jgi:hypothetical protein
VHFAAYGINSCSNSTFTFSAPHHPPDHILRFLDSGCWASGGVLGFESRTLHTCDCSFIYVPNLYIYLHSFSYLSSEFQ